MPIAPGKFQRQCARRSTEQRAQAKARLLGPPTPTVPTPTVKTFDQYATDILRRRGQIDRLLGVPRALVGGGTGGSSYQIINSQYVPNNEFYLIDSQQSNIQYMNFHTYAGGGNTMPYTYQTQGIWDTWTNSMTIMANQVQIIWQNWQDAVTSDISCGTPLTPEQRAANEQRVAERQRVAAIAAEERQVAYDRALHLFLSVLNPQERESYEKEQCIYVRGSRGRRYRIWCNGGQSGNVEWLDERGSRLASLCCHPRDMVPHPDAWMVQKLTLEHEEESFVALANYSGAQRPAELVRAA